MLTLGLEDKVVFVTGGNRGIGAATVNLLSKLGAKVAYTSRNGNNSMNRYQNGTLAVEADVTKPETLEAAAQLVEEKLEPVYGVVANAGMTKDNFYPKLSFEDWDATIDVNLKGAALSRSVE